MSVSVRNNPSGVSLRTVREMTRSLLGGKANSRATGSSHCYTSHDKQPTWREADLMLPLQGTWRNGRKEGRRKERRSGGRKSSIRMIQVFNMAVSLAKDVSGIVWAFEHQVEETRAHIRAYLLYWNSKWAGLHHAEES